MKDVSFLEMFELGPSFRWISKDGGVWHPSEMETRHLFHTVSMIWNHSMPANAATHEFKRYRFLKVYTQAYMRTAVTMMLPILLNRDDIEPEWQARIDFMRAYLAKHPNLLPAPLLALPKE